MGNKPSVQHPFIVEESSGSVRSASHGSASRSSQNPGLSSVGSSPFVVGNGGTFPPTTSSPGESESLAGGVITPVVTTISDTAQQQEQEQPKQYLDSNSTTTRSGRASADSSIPRLSLERTKTGNSFSGDSSRQPLISIVSAATTSIKDTSLLSAESSLSTAPTTPSISSAISGHCDTKVVSGSSPIPFTNSMVLTGRQISVMHPTPSSSSGIFNTSTSLGVIPSSGSLGEGGGGLLAPSTVGNGAGSSASGGSSSTTPLPSPNRGVVAGKLGMNGRSRRAPVAPRFSAESIISEAQAKKEASDGNCSGGSSTVTTANTTPAVTPGSSLKGSSSLWAAQTFSQGSTSGGKTTFSITSGMSPALSGSSCFNSAKPLSAGVGKEGKSQSSSGKYFVLHAEFDQQLPLQLILIYASPSPASLYAQGLVSKTVQNCIQHNADLWDLLMTETMLWRRLGFAGAQCCGQPSSWRQDAVSEFCRLGSNGQWMCSSDPWKDHERRGSEGMLLNSRPPSPPPPGGGQGISGGSSIAASFTVTNSPVPDFSPVKSKESQESDQSRQSSEIVCSTVDPLIPYPPRAAPFADLASASYPDNLLFQKLCLYNSKCLTDDFLLQVVASSKVGELTALDLRGSPVSDEVVEKVMRACVNLEIFRIDNCPNVTAVTLRSLNKVYPMVRSTSFSHRDDRPHQAPEFYRKGRPCNIPDRRPLAWGNFRGSQIVNNLLYLGDAADSRALPELRTIGIRRILSVAQECPASQEIEDAADINHLWMPLRDHSDEDIGKALEAGVQYIRDGILSNEPVLVHCRHGVSRSATFVIAYLMQYGVDGEKEGLMSYETAFNHTKAQRPQISPNLGFVLALHELDAKLRGTEGSQWDFGFEEGGTAQLSDTWA